MQTYLVFVGKQVAVWVVAMLLAHNAAGAYHYVNKTNATPNEPYTTPGDAANTIQEAIDAASAGATVMVYAATYDVGGRVNAGFNLTNRVIINKAISVRSVGNDPENTIIKGAWEPVSTNGPAAVRCVYMVAGSSLIGFTVTHGATLNAGTNSATYGDRYGGGIVATSASAVISNCLITANNSDGSPWATGGGGASSGTYYDCQFIGNQTGPRYSLGGGVFGATLYRCLLVSNVALRGGGAYRCTLYNCVVSNNIADKAAEPTATFSLGGGIGGWSDEARCYAYDCLIVGNRGDQGGGVGSYSILSNCTIIGNSAPYSHTSGMGGGAAGSILTDCLVISNKANNGGGTSGSIQTNCVLAYNSGIGGGASSPAQAVNCLFYGNRGYGGGVYLTSGRQLENCTLVGNGGSGVTIEGSTARGALINCIVYYNYNDGGGVANCNANSGASLALTNCCTTPAIPGWDPSNLTLEPEFVDKGSGFGLNHVAGDYHLRGPSPCLNTGTNEAWMAGATDLDGNPRLDKVTGTADMGCYEFVYSGTLILLR